jgi:fatty-acyl-CoA synthase
MIGDAVMAQTRQFHPSLTAASAPDRPAIVFAESGDSISYSELTGRINRAAHLFRSAGLRPGDGIVLLAENNQRFLEIAWAAQSSGLYYTAINVHLTPDEIGFIVSDSGAKAMVSTAHLADKASAVLARGDHAIAHAWMIDDTATGFDSYEAAVGAQPNTPIDDGVEGDFMLYSSGTTGRPKGIRRALKMSPVGEGADIVVGFLTMFGIDPETVYLSPAPLYHSAPLGWCMGVHRLGGTVVVMHRFDAAELLSNVERYSVTHTQVVPTMFVRMLKLDDAERGRHDLSSLRMVMHAAAPCPPDVKHQMIEWWGPIIYEHYSSTEGVGMTLIDSAGWLERPGSVGKPVMGAAHVLDEDGVELPRGAIGTLWFEGVTFEYHNDPERTASVKNAAGWATVGDIGYIDDDGFVFLTDRKAFTIISGGVNVYPQEIENVLITHPAVADVAVFGVPNADLGEEVKAVVQPVSWVDAGDVLRRELDQYCRHRLAS